MPSIHGGLRKNLTGFHDDLFNCHRFTAVVYLPVRGSNPAGMVLSELHQCNLKPEVWSYVVFTPLNHCRNADRSDPDEQIHRLDHGR